MTYDNRSSSEITARSGSNLALAFSSLPPERRRAMSIFYAFCRVIDDAADSETHSLEEKREQLSFWREEIRRAYLSQPESTLGREMAGIIRTYLIPPTPLEDLLKGVEMDLSVRRFETFAELERYCYGVASAVGLVSIEIFSYRQPQTRDYAVALGLAFQLTNILRDVSKDAANDRIYLPLQELRSHGLTEADVLQGRHSPAMEKLLWFQYHRAHHYFAKSLRLIHPQDRPRLVASEIMREIYQQLLEKVRRRRFPVSGEPVRLSKWTKIRCIWRAQRREKRAAPLPPKPKHVLVLGAGLAGLAAAVELARRGHRVTVLESKPNLGGRAHSFRESKSGEMIDNGQHILMGCYHETLDFLRHLRVEEKLLIQAEMSVDFASPRGFSRLAATRLPAPFHLLAGLFSYRELTWRDRVAALRMGFFLRFGRAPEPEENAQTWLERCGQTPHLIRALWEPLCLAALNQSLEKSSARLLATVLQRALFSAKADAALILSRVGLSDLFGPEAEEILRYCGGAVLRAAHVAQIDFLNGIAVSVTTLQGQILTADHVVSALPWNALRSLLPADSALAKTCHNIADSPIVSVHLWLDRPLEIPMILGFLDSPLHWLFDRSQIETATRAERWPYVAVMSGARDLAEKTPLELEEIVWHEIQRFVPGSRHARIIHRFVYKAKSATFSATPATEKIRPEAKTDWSNFWLAGDWTNTHLPATIESAVVSGRKAAAEIDAA